MKLQASYYLNDDSVFLAKDLLGKVLFTKVDGLITGGIIVETEAYFGRNDKASHAFNGRRTHRTEAMFTTGGIAYVYLCYGIHSLFNVVVSTQDDPKAILIRAVEPLIGIEIMEVRRNMAVSNKAITAGPGSLAKALGINQSFNTKKLSGEEVWIEDYGKKYTDYEITASPRVGVDYAGDHAKLPLRFFVTGNKYVSKPNK